METNDVRFNIKTLCKVYNLDRKKMLELLMHCYMIDRNHNPFQGDIVQVIKDDDEYFLTDRGLDTLFEHTNLRVDNRWLTEKNEEVDTFLKHCINRVLSKMNNQDKQISELQAYRSKYELMYSTLLSIKNAVDQLLGSNFSNFNNSNWRR